MGHDPIKYALWIGGISLAIALACSAYVVWTNGGSRNLALGLGALVGACVIFVLQIVFELKGNTASTDFAVEFVVDYGQKNVRSPRVYDQSIAVATSYRNLFIEIEASKIVAAAKPPLTKDDAPKIARDLGVISIISYLLDEQSDWQLDARSFKTSLGVQSQWLPLSTPRECTAVLTDDIREKLRAADNMFSGSELGVFGQNAKLCLPPNAVLDLTSNSVAIRTRVCSIIFTFQDPFSSMVYIDPHVVAAGRKTKQPINAIVDNLPDGSPRYATVVIGARATVEFAELHAQDRDVEKYRKWADRITEGVKARFEWPD